MKYIITICLKCDLAKGTSCLKRESWQSTFYLHKLWHWYELLFGVECGQHCPHLHPSSRIPAIYKPRFYPTLYTYITRCFSAKYLLPRIPKWYNNVPRYFKKRVQTILLWKIRHTSVWISMQRVVQCPFEHFPFR